jgi:hypothetical protein
MGWPERLFANRHGASMQGLCLDKLALCPIERSEVADNHGNLGVLRTKRLFRYRQGTLEKGSAWG